MKLFRIEPLRPPYGVEILVRASTAHEAWRKARMSEAFSDVVVIELADETPDLAESAARGRGRNHIVESLDRRVLGYCATAERAERLADAIGGRVRSAAAEYSAAVHCEVSR